MKLSGILSVLLILIVYSGCEVSAQDRKAEENELIDWFFRHLYNFSFAEADSMIVLINQTEIDKATIFNLKANLDWWKLLSGDSIDRNLKNCNFNINESINALLKSGEQDTRSLINLIYSYSLKARLENYNGNTLKSLVYFYKSGAYVKKCIDSPVKDEKLYLELGLYLYFADYIENEYFITKPLFLSLPRGDKSTGLRYLEDCSVSGNEMISTEANYFLLKIYMNVEKEYNIASLRAEILTREHPENLVYRMEQIKVLHLLKKTNEAGELQKKLAGEIEASKSLSNIQKIHFISQLNELTASGN